MTFRHLFVVFVGFPVVYSKAYKDIATLRPNLLPTYCRSMRQMKSQNTAIQMSLLMGVRSLQEFDVVNGVVSSSLYFYEMWMDEYINWIRQQYGNLSVIYIPFPDVWCPQLTVKNSVEEFDLMAQRNYFKFIEYSPIGNTK